MKDKYTRERFPLWFVFGECEGLCDISDGGCDVLVGVPRTLADRIIQEHNNVVNRAIDEIMQLKRSANGDTESP